MWHTCLGNFPGILLNATVPEDVFLNSLGLGPDGFPSLMINTNDFIKVKSPWSAPELCRCITLSSFIQEDVDAVGEKTLWRGQRTNCWLAPNCQLAAFLWVSFTGYIQPAVILASSHPLFWCLLQEVMIFWNKHSEQNLESDPCFCLIRTACALQANHITTCNLLDRKE